tara:strand:+ start:11196 stop:13871 length:2676 start_codon:yes stop_codon:yes gene_type:complete
MRYYLITIFLFLSLNTFAQFEPAPSFFRTPRELPLVDLNTTATISVASYGAVINDGIDDSTAITNAINAAVSIATEQNPVRLLFENGTYDLMPTTGSHSLSMIDAEGVLWDGQNAEFIIHNPTIGFLSLLRCTNTIIKDFSVDYATLPFSQGVVTKVDAANGFFEFTVEDNFPLPTTSDFMNAPQRWGMFKNAKGGIKEGTKNLIPHNLFFESIGPRAFRYGNQSSSTLENAEVGDYFVHIGRYNGSTVIRNTEGKNLTYMNVTAYTSPAGGFNARDSEEWNVINCHIKLKAGRVQTTNADGMHVNGGKIGPWVEDSSFEGFSDDFMNIKYARRSIKEIHNSTQITVLNSVNIGENMEFYNPRDGVLLGNATVNNVEALGSNLFKLTLSNAVNITTINNDDDQLADKAYIETRSNESMIFRNNVVRNSRRYGILIQSKYALIENNTFQNLSGAAIRIENGVDWGEGFRATQIEIRNNTIENCGYDKTYIDESNSAAISVDFAKLQVPCTPNGGFCGTETTAFRAHSDIRIIDNTILYNKKGLYLKNIEGLTVENNFMCHRDEDITLGTNQSAEDRVIFNSGNVTIEEFEATLPNPNIQFILNESASATELLNSGTNQNVGLQINTSGGTITQGFFDSEIGNSFNINTNNNGDLSLVNTSDNSDFPGPVMGAARTFTFWVKPTEATFQTLMYSGGGSLEGEIFSIQMQTNRMLRVTDSNGNFVRMQDMPLDIGEWNHIAITVPENNSMFSIQMYKNGVSSEEYHEGNDVLINTVSNALRFFPNFRGLASDIRYFDYKLCGSEVESLFNDRQITLSNDDIADETNKLKVYPTLVSDMVYFSKPITSIKVINLLGKTVITQKGADFSELNLSSLSTGIYILRINNTQSTKIYKK